LGYGFQSADKEVGAAKMKYYLGVDLGGTNIAAGVVDEHFRIIAKHSIPTLAGRSVDEISSDLAKVSRHVISQAGLKVSDFTSWGIGMPSCLNPKTGRLVHSNNMGWRNVLILDTLGKYLDLPIIIENDANCAALGESLNGAARDFDNAVLITLGTGVGGGLILDRKIYSGADHMGGELGHIKMVCNGTTCTCGQKGCFEAYASATALIRQTQEAMKRNPKSIMNELSGGLDKVTGRTAFDAARKGDAAALGVVDQYAEYIACGLSSLITIFRPEVIIIGGGISNEGGYLLDRINDKILVNTFGALECGVPSVIKAQLGNDAGIIGAAMLELCSTMRKV